MLKSFASVLYELTHMEVLPILILRGFTYQEIKASVLLSKNSFLEFCIFLES